MKTFHVIFIVFIGSIFLVNCYGQEKNEHMYKKFALEYFQFRKIQNVIMFLCWPIRDQIDIISLFNGNYISVAVPDIKYVTRTKRNSNDPFRVYTKKLGVLFDSNCFNSSSTFSTKHKYFNASYVWLVLGDLNSSLPHLKTLPLSVISDMIVATEASPGLELFDVYHTGFDRGGVFNVTAVGSWRGANTWKRFFVRVQALRRANLNGLVIKAVTLTEGDRHGVADTETYLMDETRPYVDTMFKMNYQLIRLLQSINNFSIEFVLAEDWSAKNSHGTFNSGTMLGLLQAKKGDILAGGVRYTSDKVEVGDVVYFTYPFRAGFILRYFGQFGNVRVNLYTPFHKYVWYCYLGNIILMVAVTWFILSFENKYVRNKKNRWNLSDAILFFIGACCQMGSEVTPVTSASRIVYFMFLLASLVLYNYFTSSIVSTLLNYREQKFALSDLADSSLKCGSVDVGFVRSLLFTPKPWFPELVYFNSKKFTGEKFYYTIEDGIKYVKSGDFAYHAEYPAMYKVIENTFEPSEICELVEIETMAPYKCVILSMKHSPYTEMFKIGLTKMDETGQINRHNLKWMARKPICQSGKSFSVVSLDQLGSTYGILYIGVGLALAMLLFERVTIVSRCIVNRGNKIIESYAQNKFRRQKSV